ncbi:uncharacterized protein B0P05DRAFT_546237 [Gilbertella persicaria]|uniref:uncharacterized protein n=1 Tax=Gilbertella persicaria TaxID=101096 RepID=UPI00222054F4|nr:uncharacterized protein B0P05DRAFT_546237 [Gilbertella persicaria]KAI8076529.1 hypothetical protein B0P05DRAFT_546237 [Gilbertella persicaria]
MDNQRTLCEECLAKQQLVYQLLSEYIPDEDDPSYESRCESADRYKAELHQRHKVCNECQAKINQLVQEQFITLRKKGANTNVLESQILASKGQQIESLTRLKRCSLRLKMVCFVIVHITTIAFLLMAIQYPPYRSYISFESSKLKNVLSYDTWGECFEQLMMAGFSLFVKDTWRLILTFSHCMLVNDLATCDWDVHSYLGRLSLLNMASFYIYNWHPILSSRFIYEEHIKYWTLYKVRKKKGLLYD